MQKLKVPEWFNEGPGGVPGGDVMLVLFLCEVDQAGEGQDCDGHQDDQKTQLLVGLPQGEY